MTNSQNTIALKRNAGARNIEMPAGVAVIHSTQLPFPDSGVSTTVTANNVVDQMVIEWPQIGMSYDLSTYTYGTLAFHAPAWSGVITGIL